MSQLLLRGFLDHSAAVFGTKLATFRDFSPYSITLVIPSCPAARIPAAVRSSGLDCLNDRRDILDEFKVSRIFFFANAGAELFPFVNRFALWTSLVALCRSILT